MARTALSVNTLARAGDDIEARLSAANVDGHSVPNTGQMFLVVKNTNASTCTVTIQTPKTVDGLAVAEMTFDVAQDEIQIVGLFPTSTFNQSGGVIYADFSAVTDVSIAAYRVG